MPKQPPKGLLEMLLEGAESPPSNLLEILFPRDEYGATKGCPCERCQGIRAAANKAGGTKAQAATDTAGEEQVSPRDKYAKYIVQTVASIVVDDCSSIASVGYTQPGVEDVQPYVVIRMSEDDDSFGLNADEARLFAQALMAAANKIG